MEIDIKKEKEKVTAETQKLNQQLQEINITQQNLTQQIFKKVGLLEWLEQQEK